MDQTTHSVEFTEEEIVSLLHAMSFTEGEGQEGDNKVWYSAYKKLLKMQENVK